MNQQLYQQAAAKSYAGASLLTLLTTQLGVSPDDAKSVSSQVIGGKLQDPLGGNYVLVDQSQPLPGEQLIRWPVWMSDAWMDGRVAISPLDAAEPPPNAPAGYTTPLLHWFRGADLELTQYADRLLVDAAIQVDRSAVVSSTEGGLTSTQSQPNQSTPKPQKKLRPAEKPSSSSEAPDS